MTKKGVATVAFVSMGRSFKKDDPIDDPHQSWIDAGWVKVEVATKRKTRRREKKVLTDG